MNEHAIRNVFKIWQNVIKYVFTPFIVSKFHIFHMVCENVNQSYILKLQWCLSICLSGQFVSTARTDRQTPLWFCFL
jgi:hypothetical protein